MSVRSRLSWRASGASRSAPRTHARSTADYLVDLRVDASGNTFGGTNSTGKVHQYNASGVEVISGSWPFDTHGTDPINRVGLGTDGNVYTASDDGSARKVKPDGSEDTAGSWPLTASATYTAAAATPRIGAFPDEWA